uniref:BK_channel_a domain-containing protein n=1 Tax=Steinernema glaseri TaxID=37863 RepID=A0A1I7YH98_9BILA
MGGLLHVDLCHYIIRVWNRAYSTFLSRRTMQMQSDMVTPQWYVMRSYGVTGPYSPAEMLLMQYNNQLDGCLIRVMLDSEFATFRDYFIAAGCSPFMLNATALYEVVNRKNGVPSSMPWAGIMGCQALQNAQMATNLLYATQVPSVMSYSCMSPSPVTLASSYEVNKESAYAPFDENKNKREKYLTIESAPGADLRHAGSKKKKPMKNSYCQTLSLEVSSDEAGSALSELIGIPIIVEDPGDEK